EIAEKKAARRAGGRHDAEERDARCAVGHAALLCRTVRRTRQSASFSARSNSRSTHAGNARRPFAHEGERPRHLRRPVRARQDEGLERAHGWTPAREDVHELSLRDRVGEEPERARVESGSRDHRLVYSEDAADAEAAAGADLHDASLRTLEHDIFA